MRIKNLDVGVEQVTHWQAADEVHLPAEDKVAPAFLPQERALDAILQRPSLDERLPNLLEPSGLDPSLLEPAALARTRDELGSLFRRAAASAHDHEDSAVFSAAAEVIAADQRLDDEVRTALAMLLRG